MKVGLTYDLKSEYIKEGFTDEEAGEFDSEETIDAIEKALQENGYETVRIGNARSLMSMLHEGNCWDIVFNICEGMYGIGREAQVPAILDIYNIPYTFSDVLVSSLTLHKAMTKRIIRDAGLPTANFVVIETENDLQNVNLTYPLFAKPVAEGTGKGIDNYSKITEVKQLIEVSKRLLTKFKQPVLIEEYLEGREFTVGIVGTGSEAQVIGVCEVILRSDAEEQVYSYYNKENCEKLVIYKVTEEPVAQLCKELSLKCWNVLNCRDGGRIDLKLNTNNIPNFLEVNPLAGLHPLHSDLPILAMQKGLEYKDLIKMIMDSAVKRIKPNY